MTAYCFGFAFLFFSLANQTLLPCYLIVQAGLELVALLCPAFLVWVYLASALCWLLPHFEVFHCVGEEVRMPVAEVRGHLVDVGSPSTILALETEFKLSGLAASVPPH